MEEINKNDHILPNISLLVNIECGLELYGERTDLALKSKELIPNYYCRNHRRYLIVLTTPKWGVSTSIGQLLYISRIPEVSHVKIILRK
jgi:vomeronasal 2 receptor